MMTQFKNGDVVDNKGGNVSCLTDHRVKIEAD